jgi:Rrf2 family iron-sulfur cluster assembly transcriptional regulator
MTGNKSLKLTTRGRYAVMAMIELACREDKEPVPLAEIAESGDISLSYLEQLFSGLRKHGLVKSYRGPGGGYILARQASEIRISDILDSAEDCVPAKRAQKGSGRVNGEDSKVAILWGQMGEILYASMKHISLEDVVSDRVKTHPAMNKLFEVLA